MLEGTFTRKLLAALKQRLPNAVIWKHSDRFNAGVPDCSITLGSATLWIEIKMQPKMPEKIQEYYLSKLKHGGVLICASRDGKTAVWTNPYPDGVSRFVSFEVLVNDIARWF